MSENKVLELCCTNPNCKKWFRSPFFHGYLNTFDVNALKGLKAQCPVCGRMVTGTPKNVRIRTIYDDHRMNKTS
ncbi:hypothetical protein [Bacillus sp. 03113]|uniref:hypothetical protein n=1 Tax=Bacillus sp. 03113 TaxID=2578211 RepID=UPI0011420334|nr:hypothetical protein [Bacillus sp. 03113]